MAGHEWDWFQREELIGQISDIRVQNLQVERENVQKRTFTRWMNLHLEKCKPPLEVTDLFVDIQDGKILMALLEVLTGQSLLHEYKSSTHRIFRLNNIAKALKFLEDSNVKLVSIDAAEIADGNPSLVLGLIWNIILFLQIKELTGNLNRMSSSSSLSSLPSGTDSDTSHPSTPSTEKGLSVSIKDQRKAIKALLNWVQQRTRKYGVAVQDFASSWRSGLAFLAVIKAIDSSLVDMKRALEKPPRENLEDAFSIAQKKLNIPRLLEPEDLMVDSPDEHSIMTYVTQFLEHFPELNPDDFSDHAEETPLEMTYVHYKDGPSEEEGKIITVSKHEDMDFSVEVRTRHLNLPETHDYTEVDIPYDSKRYHEESGPNPFKVSMGFKQSPVQQTHGGFKLNNVSRKLEYSSTLSDTLDRAVAKEIHDDRNGGDDLLHINSLAESGPNFNSDVPKEHDDHVVNHTIMDKEPNRTDSATLNPSQMANHHEALAPSMTNEEDEACKYLIHLPKDSDHKQMTVFKAYKASTEDQPDHKIHNVNSSVDGGSEETNAKVSVIPHDLFYYPHYSVPICDVLQAFADHCPDSGMKCTAASDDSSERYTDSKGSLNAGNYVDTKATGVAQSEPAVDLEDVLPVTGHKKMVSPELSEGSISNGSILQPTHGRNSAVDAGYNKAFQDTGGNENLEKNHKNQCRKGYNDSKSEWDHVDYHVTEDRTVNLAAETQETKLNNRLYSSRDVQSDSHAYNRKKLNCLDHMNVGNRNEDGEKLSEHRKQGLGDAPPSETVATGSSLSFWNSQLPDIFYITILLWLLCYCILILPELDLNKVQLFAFNN